MATKTKETNKSVQNKNISRALKSGKIGTYSRSVEVAADAVASAKGTPSRDVANFAATVIGSGQSTAEYFVRRVRLSKKSA